VEIPKIVKSEQKGKPKQEMFLDDEFNEEYDIMEDPDFHMGEWMIQKHCMKIIFEFSIFDNEPIILFSDLMFEVWLNV